MDGMKNFMKKNTMLYFYENNQATLAAGWGSYRGLNLEDHNKKNVSHVQSESHNQPKITG